jgi:hypothetical protein
MRPDPDVPILAALKKKMRKQGEKIAVELSVIGLTLLCMWHGYQGEWAHAAADIGFACAVRLAVIQALLEKKDEN